MPEMTLTQYDPNTPNISVNISGGDILHVTEAPDGNKEIHFQHRSTNVEIKVSDAVAVVADKKEVLKVFDQWLQKEILLSLPKNLQEFSIKLIDAKNKMLELDRNRSEDRKVFDLSTIADVRKMIISRYISNNGELGQEINAADINEFLKISGELGQEEYNMYRDLNYYKDQEDQCYPVTKLRLDVSPQLAIDNFSRCVDDRLLSTEGVLDHYRRAAMGVDLKNIEFGRFQIIMPKISDIKKLPNGDSTSRAEKSKIINQYRDYFKSLQTQLGNLDILRHPVPELGFIKDEEIYLGGMDTILNLRGAQSFSPVEAIKSLFREGTKISHINLSNLCNSLPKMYCACLSEKTRKLVQARELQTVTCEILKSISFSPTTLQYLKQISLPLALEIDNEVLAALCDILEQAANIRKISLAHSKLCEMKEVDYLFKRSKKEFFLRVSEDIWNRFLNFISNARNIEELDLSHNFFNDKLGNEILQAIINSVILGSKLRSLNLEGNYLTYDDGIEPSNHSITSLIEIIERASLLKLNIDKCGILGADLSQIIHAIGYKQSLQRLIYKGNKLEYKEPMQCCSDFIVFGCSCCISEDVRVVTADQIMNAENRLKRNADISKIFQVAINVTRQGQYLENIREKESIQVSKMLINYEEKLKKEKAETEATSIRLLQAGAAKTEVNIHNDNTENNIRLPETGMGVAFPIPGAIADIENPTCSPVSRYQYA